MFLIRPRFWLLAAALMLVAAGITFGFVSHYHKQSQDPKRSPSDQQGLENTSETIGYVGAAFSGLFFICLLIAGACWLVAVIVGAAT